MPDEAASEPTSPSEENEAKAADPAPAPAPSADSQDKDQRERRRRAAAVTPPRPPTPAPSPVRPAPQIVGLSQLEMTAALGPPHVERDQPPAKIWQYRAGDCEVDVFFYLDVARNNFYALQYDVKPPNAAPVAKERCLSRLRDDAGKR